MNRVVDKELEKQMELLVKDLKIAYESSGKKVSGKWEEGLEVKYEPNSATLLSYTYLSGRVKGKFPPLEKIKRWIEQRGIRPYRDNMTTSQLAFVIAKKIAEQGTNSINHFKIFETIITPQRIQQIIEAVNTVNVNWFVNELQARMSLITKNK